jgi:MFS family permease
VNRWKIDLAILWFGCFLLMSGMTMIMPFLPLYLKEMGLTDEHEIAFWSGAIFASNFITSFIFQPIWGRLSDRYGRKIMLLRSGFGMTLVIVLMGFARHPWQLLLLRVANGVISGFNPAAVALVSASAPKERIGFAMGVLQSGAVAGSILGPLFGGLMADLFGFRPIFWFTGLLMLAATLLVLFFVRETFDRAAAARAGKTSLRQSFASLVNIRQLPALYGVSFVIQFASLATMPVMPLFIEALHGSAENLAFLSGLVSSINGIASLIASPVLGRLSDRFGPARIMQISLVGAALSFVPQAFASGVWQLMAARFVHGLFMGGLNPTINALIRKFAPEDKLSQAYGFNSSFISLGNMIGPTAGGALSGFIGIPGVFLVSSALLAVNAASVYAFTRRMARPS